MSYSTLSYANALVSIDLGEEAKRSLVENYLNSKSFSNRLIFRKIVKYKLENKFAEQH
jgi:hypothetical protein